MNIKGTKANDDGADRPSLIGSAEEDRFFGLAGDDAIIGGGGDDRIFGGTGHDRLIGGGWSRTRAATTSRATPATLALTDLVL